MFWRRHKETKVQEIKRIDSPKIVRERPSKDVIDPRNTRKTGDLGMKNAINIVNEVSWTEKYNVINKEFARGSYGKIFLAEDKITKEQVIIKQIPTSTPIKMINQEVYAGKIIGTHSNIAGLLSYNETSDFHYLVFQYVKGGDMFSWFEKIGFAPRTESTSRNMIVQVLDCLNYLHSKNIAHRDLKLENILIDPQTEKLTVIDFGLCAINDAQLDKSQPQLRKEWCGSDNYVAPEVVRKIAYDSYKADIFSAGVVLFCLLFGVFPFNNLRVCGVRGKDGLPRLKVRFPSDVPVSDEAKDLVLKMLEDDPQDRFSLDQVLNHSWIKQQSK